MSTHFIDGLAVEIDGEGPPIVCIHGLGGTSNTWVPVMSAMQGRKVIRIDLPGSGRSDVPRDDLTIAQMANAVLGVCRQLDVKQAVFVGHSMGTIVCQHLAVQNPDMVESLVLFGPLLCPPDAGRPGILARAEKAATGGQAAMQEIADAIVAGATSKETKAENPVGVAMVRESLMRQPSAGYAQSCKALAASSAADIDVISVPTLLITGDQDGVAPPASVTAIAQRITGSRMVVLSECGHWQTFEKPAESAKHLREFLA